VRQCDDAAIGKQWERRPKGIHSNPRATWDDALGEKGGGNHSTIYLKKKNVMNIFLA